MSRQIGVNDNQNDSNDPSEDSFINECESCCYEFQHARARPYKCMFDDVLRQYKMRLKKTQMELTDKELIIALLKDQQAKMENYCRNSLEETQNIKAKYNHLVQEMDIIRKEYGVLKNEPMDVKEERLESYLKAEVDLWKRENKEILGKIELINSDVQKLLNLMVVDRLTDHSGNDITVRMAKLERIIENQSAILAQLHTIVTEHSKAITDADKKVASQFEEVMKKGNEFQDDIIGPKSPAEYKARILTRDAATDTETDVEGIPHCVKIKGPEADTIHSEIMADFLEIAAKEEKYFDEYIPKSEYSVLPSRSANPSEFSEFTMSEHGKLFRELPVDVTDTSKNRIDTYEGFNEFEHFESAIYTNGKDPNLYSLEPTKTEVNKKQEEMNRESKKNLFVGSIPECCIIPNKESTRSDSSYDHEVRIVLFHGLKNSEKPNCCKTLEDLDNSSKNDDKADFKLSTDEEKHSKNSSIISEKDKTLDYKVHENLYSSRPHSTSHISVSEEEIPALWPTILDETSSSSSKIESALHKGLITEKVLIPSQSTNNTENSQTTNEFPEQNKKANTKKEADISTMHSEKNGNEIPACCETLEEPKKDVVIEENISYKSLNKNFSNPKKKNETKESVNEVILDKLIKKNLETVPKTLKKEEITRKHVVPHEEEPVDIEGDISQNTGAVDHEKLIENKIPPLGGDRFHETVNKLDDTSSATKQELSTLHSLKNELENMNKIWNQDQTKIVSNIEITNDILNGIKKDIHTLKKDVKTILLVQEKQNECQIKDNNPVKEEHVEETKHTLERIKMLEKHLCKCTNIPNKKISCYPSTGCSCKYKAIDRRLREENDTKDRKISFTVQPCLLNPNVHIRAPYIMRVRENIRNTMPALTYETCQEYEVETTYNKAEDMNH